MMADSVGQRDVVNLLIGGGADIRATDINGKTAAMYAAEKLARERQLAMAQSRGQNWAMCVSHNPTFAIQACTALIQSGQETSETVALALEARGNVYDGLGDHEKAIQDYNEAFQTNPSSATLLYNRALALAGKGDVERALEDYNTAISNNPQMAEAFNGRGTAFVRRGDYDRALADFDQAIA